MHKSSTPRAQTMELLVGWILLAGVLLSACCLVIGVIWNGWTRGTLDYSLAGRSVAGFVHQELRDVARGPLRPSFFINAGLTLLTMTPYARVAASLVYFFFVERNVKYASFTSVVLGVLTYTLFGH